MSQGVNEQVRPFAGIETEGHFVEIGRKILGTDVVPCSGNAALEKREGRFNRVGMNVAVNINARLVIDRSMLSNWHGIVNGLLVSRPFISHKDLKVSSDVLANVAGKCAALSVLRVEQAKLAAALTNTDHDFLVMRWLFASNHPALATDKRLIHCNRTTKHRGIDDLHCFADAMAQIPRGFVAHAKHSLDLIRAHALARLAEQIDRTEPLDKGQVRIVEYGVRGYGKLVVALFAVEKVFRGFERCCRAFAARAFRAHWPAEAL